jgi:hypothetical protein
LKSSAERTSMMVGAVDSPTKRINCDMVISVFDGMSVHPVIGSMDAMFGLPPHGVIAINPLSAILRATLLNRKLCRRASLHRYDHPLFQQHAADMTDEG